MNRLIGAIVALSLLAPSATAQILSIMPDGTVAADWAEVAKCAAQPNPERPKGDITSSNIAAYSDFERQWQIISYCRLAIGARHAGWTAATDAPDPYAPRKP